MYYALLAAVVALDQATKHLADVFLGPGSAGGGIGAVSVIPGFFDIAYTRNTGAAFSILQGQRAFLILFPLALVVALQVFVFLRRGKEPPLLLAALTLISAGGLGNLIDRARLGSVVDFFAFMSFPVFNVADVAVCVGCGLAVLSILRSERRGGPKSAEGSRERAERDGEGAGRAAEGEGEPRG
ncbi:MAG: signal peptidase II [Clostridiales Family XIII bacterium]|jgi:signal peptidase II|nr:signal peptidase II [Clostridiales Family XIII bacterium]